MKATSKQINTPSPQPVTQAVADNVSATKGSRRPPDALLHNYQRLANNSSQVTRAAQLQARVNNHLATLRTLHNGVTTQLMQPAYTNGDPDRMPAADAEEMATTPGGPVLQGVFTYTASVVLDRAGAEKKKAADYQLDNIKLPDKARPATQFGTTQMAHSVSWTLLKKSYEAVTGLKLDTFIDDYLKKDWKALAQQKDMGRKAEAQELFNSYLLRYTDSYFDDLKTADKSFLEWYGVVQRLVTDYFVALQLAPLSTHTGFTQKIGDSASGVHESRPSGHGEPAANDFFQRLEAAGGTGQPPLAVVTHAKAYWDPGIGMVGGINEAAEVTLLLEKFEKTFARAYPKTWATYEANIKADLSDAARRAVAPYSGKGHSKPGKVPTETEEVGDDADSGGFQAKIALNNASGGGGVLPAENFEIKEYTIKEVALPDDRPVTKYGIAGQKSHTVSWTLVLQNLTNLGKNRTLKKFLQELLLKWLSLQNQDWDSMIGSNLIAASDFKSRDVSTATLERYNSENSTRLTNLKAKLAPNINQLAAAIAGYGRTDLEWAAFVQNVVADYVLVYQSAPLTTYKAEVTPSGHGEADANTWLGKLEKGDKTPADWEKKFRNDLFAKKRAHLKLQQSDWKDKKDISDRSTALGIARKVHKGEVLEAGESVKVFEILVKRLGRKYLDVGWGGGLAKIGGELRLDYSPAQLAKVLVEWEEVLQEAFPVVWATYGPLFKAHSENYELSEGLKGQQAHARGTTTDLLGEHGTMKSWVQAERTNRAYQAGLVSIKSGDENPEFGNDAYNRAKTEYNSGRIAAQTDPLAVMPTGNGNGYEHGYQDYVAGYQAAVLNPDTPVPGGHNLAYKTAYQTFVNGYLAAKAAPGTPLPGGQQAAYNNAFNAYQQGYAAALAAPANPLPGGHPAAYNHAYQDYVNGYQASVAAVPGTPLGGLHSAAYTNGYQHYQQGYQTAEVNPTTPMPGGWPAAFNNGFQEYRNGYNAAAASPGNILAPGAFSGVYTLAYTHFYNGYINGRDNTGLQAFVGTWAYDHGHTRGQLIHNGTGANGAKRRKVLGI
ncbi:MAG TPA: hypothetical protein VFS25_15900 [Chitinophaga sp.]|uniref:hypothetical protein n=1 Tax=Chitinophaga sp. TaxID=1869181 RepID=UPI002DB7A5A9|nr:hypothetical protein [Chitinophaga sp.]HEU4554330.1 hypothetical protein [Chitinophaga sp.]